jgi:hypothetical protein
MWESTSFDPEEWRNVCELKYDSNGVVVPCRIINGIRYCEAKCAVGNPKNALWGYVTCSPNYPHAPIREGQGCPYNWQGSPPDGWT